MKVSSTPSADSESSNNIYTAAILMLQVTEEVTDLASAREEMERYKAMVLSGTDGQEILVQASRAGKERKPQVRLIFNADNLQKFLDSEES